MQKRHNDRKQYFEELANTSRRYYIPHLQRHMVSGRPTRVLEIGCGEGGCCLLQRPGVPLPASTSMRPR